MPTEQFSSTLPADFDGVFRFTNWSDDEFTAYWNSKAYVFPALKTSPMNIMDATPLEVQSIRKKFAKELATREYFKKNDASVRLSERPNNNAAFGSLHQGGIYNDNDLSQLIQRALEPLPQGSAQVRTDLTPPNLPNNKQDVEERLSEDDEGEKNTTVLGKNTDVRTVAKNPRPKL